ncbi:hypothetical protein EDEG_00646 [Edhazardia aedis USNM 41457]|uniref:General transcription and DNA repair factor IIH subunit TFB4 n=1 Tax=Edhazardia aedis (strain USNM 41457) TaxID=1003232 RepID=J9A054_EDHAE|nr:hypothetical protein EDEG_00646 [Edhazardia aedis USNM 41457]|eukprot:EJW05288.1 hypothetical protein EDEG_00646 [Edhazardia aedis USNM 41457]
MYLYLIADLRQENWQSLENPKELYNNLILFLNIFQTLSYSNYIQIICNRQIIFESKKNDIKSFVKNLEYKVCSSNLAQDIAYTLCLINKNRDSSEARIFVLNLDYQDNNTIQLLKVSTAAKNMKIRIDSYSSVQSPVLSQVCNITGGIYRTSLDIFVNLFGFYELGDESGTDMSGCFGNVKCICHGNIITLGLVCPICLAIYCRTVPICRVCKTKIDFRIKK